MLLSEAVEKWVTQRRSEGYSPHTLRSYKLQMRLLIRDIGDRPADEITLYQLRGYIATHSGRLKPASSAHRVRMIKSFFTWCVEEGVLVRSPAHKLREPKMPARIPKALNFEDLELLRESCRTLREHALVEFLFASGCRAAEVSGIQRADIDWNRRAVIVMGKGNKQREVYFGAKALIWLRRYAASRKDDHPSLFTTEKGPIRPLLPRQVWWVVKRVAAHAGMRPRIWPHLLRHTLATTLLNQGAPLVAVQSILGHAKSDTTLIYAHLSGANRQAAFEKYFMQ